ncbi:MAG TPA: hypothetical protein DEP05_09625, partial [Betaproteobacteria bacterium]|nr:hypothetical protein [Betaproteobacteria bacterium]
KAAAAAAAGAAYLILPGWMARPSGVSPAAVAGKTRFAGNARPPAAVRTAPPLDAAAAGKHAAPIPHASPATPQRRPAIAPAAALQTAAPHPPAAKPAKPHPAAIRQNKTGAPVAEHAGGASGVQAIRAAWRQTLAATHGWLMRTPPSHYTIQLMMEYGANAVIAWNTLHRIKTVLSSRAVYVYPTRASGKPAFSFVYGDFATAAAAKAARTRLPPAYQANLPTLRTIKGIRGELRANGVRLPSATAILLINPIKKSPADN